MTPTVTLMPLTMQGAADFWKDKILLGPGGFAKLSDAAKIRAFSVSGIAKGDELTTVYNSLQRAIEKGISFPKFKQECAEIFARRGWTGKREWRVQNIFRTNIQTAYNSARYQKQKEVADTFPYLQYSAVNDRRTRPTHKAVDDMVFPIDHPFWDQWYPPNGYRCRCSTFSLTRSQVERRGLKVETEDPTNTPVAIPSPVTGAKIHVQQLLPDPGFGNHPGKLVWGGMVDDGARYNFKQMNGLAGPSDFRRPALGNVRPGLLTGLNEKDLLAAGKGDDFYRNEFIQRYGEETLVKDGAGEPVVLSLRAFLVDKKPGADENKKKWKFGRAGHGESIPLLKEMIEKPYEIWLTPQQDAKSGRVRLSKRYISLWKTADKKQVGGLIVFEVADGIFKGVTGFIPLKKSGGADLSYAERRRKGLLLYPRR